MSLLKCCYCEMEVESGLQNIFNHMEACKENKTTEVLSESVTAVYTKPLMFEVLASDLSIEKESNNA